MCDSKHSLWSSSSDETEASANSGLNWLIANELHLTPTTITQKLGEKTKKLIKSTADTLVHAPPILDGGDDVGDAGSWKTGMLAITYFSWYLYLVLVRGSC